MKINIQIRIIVSCVIFIALSIMHVIVLNADSTDGDILTDISENISLLSRENLELSAKVASASSISTISEKAYALGMTTSVKTLSLTSAPQLSYSNETNL